MALRDLLIEPALPRLMRAERTVGLDLHQNGIGAAGSRDGLIWRRAFDADFLVSEGTIDPEDRELFWYAETAQDIWRDILLWYEMRGAPLLAPGAIEAVCDPQHGTAKV